MKAHQREFIELAIRAGALKFGEFTLKSGRISPYFFNAGTFSSGSALDVLGRCYAEAIVESGVDMDIIFGPAYKGIPLAASTAVALARQNIDKSFAFNRKEAKQHGEGGTIVGAPLAGRVLIIDDVITAGTAVREVIDIIRSHGAEPAGVVIGLDRCERGQGELSAVQEVERDYGIPVVSIIRMDHVLGYLQEQGESEGLVAAMTDYRIQYGV
ncbi:MAG: orotate phosphoribosyltransferase [Pseudomonadales bacterium]